MVLPIGDAPSPRGVPVVTYLLIAANVAVYGLVTLPLGAEHVSPADPRVQEYLAVLGRELRGRVPLDELARQVTAYDLFVFGHGFRPARPSLSTLFVSMFLHGGLLHLVGNMLFLWIYGDNVEHRLGRVGYLLAYLASGVAATWTHAVLTPDPFFPVVGASGAISGLWGAASRLLGGNGRLAPIFGRQVVSQAVVFTVLNILIGLAGGFAQLYIAWEAHVAGCLAGLLLIGPASLLTDGSRGRELPSG